MTQLDHAAYLGRELAKAEAALSDGVTYEQDAALGRLRSGGAAQNEKVRLPMQLDRELASGDETPSKTQVGK